DLTVQRGNGPTSGVGGGGVYAQNPLSLLRTRIRDNRAGAGGGLYVLSSSATITESTLSENQALTSGAGGGGLYNQGGTTVTLVNTTVANNTGHTGGGLWVYGDAVLANVTLSGNQAVNGGGISGNGAMTARNTIIANNTATITANCSILAPTSQGFNLVFPGTGIDTCGFTQGTDKRNQDPKLGPLQNNGGPTETMALGSRSAAIDAGSTATPGSGGTACSASDQRGTARPVDGDGISGPRCDIGAYEAAFCTTRPKVSLGVAPGAPGRISVSVAAGSGNITELRLHAQPSTNIEVSIGALVNQTGELTVPINAPTAQFSIRRVSGSGSGTLPFDVVDGCGVWQSFAGGGPNAWPAGSSGVGINSPSAVVPPAEPPRAGTPSIASCSPRRPDIGVATSKPNPGQLQITLSAPTLPDGTANGLSSITIGSIENAAVSVNGSSVTAGQSVTLPAGTQQVTVLLDRRAPDQQPDHASNVGFVVVDACGEWKSFVGGGPEAF
ncbi:MAG: choice-of-anchor Q domain-containing protein, partial [Chloroflexota bacterium]